MNQNHALANHMLNPSGGRITQHEATIFFGIERKQRQNNREPKHIDNDNQKNGK